MAVAVVQSFGLGNTAFFGGAASFTRTAAADGRSAMSTGSAVIVCAESNQISRDITGINFGLTGTPTALTHIAHINQAFAIYFGIVTGSEGDQTVEVTASGTITDSTAYAVLEVSGLATSQATATTNTLSTSGTEIFSVPSVTPPTAANLVLVGASRGNRTYTEDSDFTSITTGTNISFVGYIVQAAATAQGCDFNCTGDGNTSTDAVIVAFAGTAGGSPLPVGSIAFTGRSAALRFQLNMPTQP